MLSIGHSLYIMRAFLTFVLAVGLAGCSLVSTDQTPDVRLTNDTEAPVIYLAMEREASNTADPNPELPRAEYADRIVEEGAPTDVEQIAGGWEKGDDLRFFIYAAPEDAEMATFTRIFDASAEELRRQDYHIRIDNL